jgi:hypothetical protein
MRPKKSKEPKKYAVGGMIAGAALGLGQAGLGAYQMFQGQQAAKRIKEASTARPSEYAELLKQARNAELEQRRLEELNRAISTGISAAQQGGGRALVGALPGMVRAGDAGALDILGQRQAQTMQALQFGAQGAEAEIGREFQREMMQREAAQSALEGGVQNVAGGLGQLGSAAAYGVFGGGKKKVAGTEGAITSSIGTPTSISDTESVLSQAAQREREANAQSLLAERDFMTEPNLHQEGGMITEGEFDHNTNPIDIIRAGKKIGEMTGGEVVLNPSQQKKLSKESAYFRSLLKKFNKQK